jgi:hypothetical protein
MEAKRVAESQVVLSQMMQPEHANILGNVHGGWIVTLIDEAGAIVTGAPTRSRDRVGYPGPPVMRANPSSRSSWIRFNSARPYMLAISCTSALA